MNMNLLRVASFLFIALLVFVSGSSFAQNVGPVFKTLQWKARVIVLTGNHNDPLVNEQIALFKDNLEGIRERDIAVIRFEADTLDEMDEFSQFHYRGWYDMDASEQGFMEKQLDLDNNSFGLALVGKDGQLKKIWVEQENAVEPAEIFAVIDEMPMAQEDKKSLLK